MCFHARLGWAKGGFLCVSVFFTLSGFLITSLVTREQDRTGQVKVTSFWARRARRLIPASLLTLLLIAWVTAVAVPAAQQASVAGDMRSALFQFANWRFIQQGAAYADFSVVPSPVQHYWSLAIEEQFYIVFPVIAALALRRRPAVLAGIFTAVVAMSVVQQARLDGIERVYYGTDARAAELAVGGLLALAWPRLRESEVLHRYRLPDILGLAGLAASVVLFLGVPQQRPAIYDGGLAAFSVVSALMVLGAVEGPIARRVIGTWPMVELGKVSYGAYLYHFPLYLLLDEDRVGLDGYALLALRVAATVALAWLSYQVVEKPIRHGTALRGGQARLALAGGVAAVLLVGIPVGAAGDDEQQLAFRDVTTTTASTTSTTLAGAASTIGATATTGPGATRTTPTTGPARPPRVVVVGDSTAAANGAGLEAWGVASGRMQVVTVSEPGCGVIEGERFTVREGYVFEPHRCDELFPKAADVAEDLDADAIVVFIGSSQLADWEYADVNGRHHLGQPTMDGRYGPALRTALDDLAAAGRPILWATVPLPMWDLEVFSRVIGSPVPGQGPVTLNDPPRTTRINQLNQAGVPGHAMARLWPYAARLTGPDGTVPTRIRPDGLHLSEVGIAEVSEAWLFDELAAAYRAVVSRNPAGLREVDRHAWSA